MVFVDVDVKALAPPEPMTVILTALAQLSEGQGLLVSHRRQPFPLYEKLLQAAWAYHCLVEDEDNVALYIYRQIDQPAFALYMKGKGL